jgi:chitinase
MSYSATPPDFGSLSIQRLRWANGGLLILTKLRRQSRARRRQGQRTRFGELFLRWNYMASICWSSVSLLILLAFPFSATLISPLLGLVALPYFMAMASDLRYCGYKRIDVFRIYGFNLVLLPVNLAGTLSSVVQGITASKAAFARTPKVRDRTVVPAFPLLAPYLLALLAGGTFYLAYRHDRVENMCYAALNFILLCYAIKAFIGLRNSFVDAWIHGTSLLYKSGRRRKRVPRRQRSEQVPSAADWRTVLEVGFVEPAAAVPPATLFGSPPPVQAAPAQGRRGSGRRGSAPPPPPAAAPPVPDSEPRRRLSLLRLLVALMVVAGLGYGGYAAAQTRLATAVITRQTWFAPYVDATLTPTYQFQNPSSDAARLTVLGFVVAEPGGGCTPSWGADYTLAQASASLAMASRIAQVEQDGAEPVVSFGGQAHTSLDVACSTVSQLTTAYQSVIKWYGLKAIDLDIEGAALDNFGAEQRRAQAIANLEQAARAAHQQLQVWLTLPVEPDGLQDNAISVVESMLADRVSITGINVMTMDFSKSPANGASMLPEVENALNSVHTQLTTLYPRYGVKLRSEQIWQRMGATVMIGQNDIQGQVFTTGNAQGLVNFANANHLGRVSMWSLNRDSQCGTPYAVTGVLSNTCSGTAESNLGFAGIFGQLQGTPTATISAGDVQPVAANTNPADAPYPQWSGTQSYPLGYRVVADGEIYQAKWYNTGDDPQAQVQYDYQTPWELLGPVLPGDHAPHISLPPAGTYATWNISTLYQVGTKVIFEGLPYQAKWTNQGNSPEADAGNQSNSPWQPLYRIPGEPASSGG